MTFRLPSALVNDAEPVGFDFRGTGANNEGAQLVVDFSFGTGGQRELEAHPAVQIGRTERPRRKPFINDQHLDQASWSNHDTDRRQAKAVWGPKVH